MSAIPTAIRTQAAQVGAGRSSPSSRRGNCVNTAVVAASPTSQPYMNARPVDRARSACSTSTIAGIIVNGDIATTNASGMSWPSTAAQLPAMGSDPSQRLTRSAGRDRQGARTRLVPPVHQERQPTKVEKHGRSILSLGALGEERKEPTAFEHGVGEMVECIRDRVHRGHL